MAAAEPSEENPVRKRFSFQLHPAEKVKFAIYSLSELEFNKNGWGLIEVSCSGMEITVLNKTTGVFGYLVMETSTTPLIEYHLKKVINLIPISSKLLPSEKDDTIIISHEEGSNHLCFAFGTEPVTSFEVKMIDFATGFENLPPPMGILCDAFIPFGTFWEILETLQSRDSDLDTPVSYDIHDKEVSITVAGKNWKQKYDHEVGEYMGGVLMKGGIWGMKPGVEHHAEFHLPHIGSLKAAAVVDHGVFVGFLTQPSEKFVLRFYLGPKAVLVYTKNVDKLIIGGIPNEQEEKEKSLGSSEEDPTHSNTVISEPETEEAVAGSSEQDQTRSNTVISEPETEAAVAGSSEQDQTRSNTGISDIISEPEKEAAHRAEMQRKLEILFGLRKPDY